MRYLMLYTPDKSKDRSQHIPRTLAKMRELTEGGRLLTAAGISNRDKGAARIRQEDGLLAIEQPASGESVLFNADGLNIISAADLQEAVDLAVDFIGAAGDGVIELTQLVDAR